jgi:hypothetical protein
VPSVALVAASAPSSAAALSSIRGTNTFVCEAERRGV